MTIWVPKLAVGQPAYLAIADEIARAIGRGELRPGERLPTHRLLADLLGLNVSTVTRAYREAARRRLVDGETGRGTYVQAGAAEAALFALEKRPDRGLIDLSTNTPPVPARDADLGSTFAALSPGEAAELLHYPTPGEWVLHRTAAAAWLQRRGIDAVPADIVICAGAQHAMENALSLFGSGTVIGAEALTYPGLKAIARQRRLRLLPLEMDAEGVTPEAFEAACRASPGRTIALSPTLQNPTTATMSLERRERIVTLARRLDAFIIEEDVYGLLPDGAPPPLAALAPERVCYVTGLSKTVAPGLRLGYLLPPPKLLKGFADAGHRSSWYVSPLAATLAERWIRDGTAWRRLLAQRSELAARHHIVQRELEGLDWSGELHCPHVWLRLRSAGAADVVECALRDGLAVVGYTVFAAGRSRASQGVRISIGAAADRRQLSTGLQILRTVINRLERGRTGRTLKPRP